jgi:hypothetical protein
LAQNGDVMHGHGWTDGYGGAWLPILLVVVVVVFAVRVGGRK